MTDPTAIEVVEVPPEATHDLRQRLLRQHMADADLDYPADRAPGSFHLGVRAGGSLLAVASFSREPAPGHPGSAARVRGMAVDPAHQGAGLGGRLVEHAVARLREGGVALLWANARTSAVGFYEAHGFTPEGEEFDSIGLPHRVVVLDLHR